MTITQEEIAQAIANSFFGMEAGYLPTEEWEMPVPSAGDMQLAFDIAPLVKRAQAEALREAAAIADEVDRQAERDLGIEYDGHAAEVAVRIRAHADRIEQGET